MAASFGVHFGSTSACLAACRDGKSEVIANDTGDRTTPAVVSFTDHDQAVGLAAKQGMIRNSLNTICEVKGMLGRCYGDPEVEAIINKSQVKIINKNDKPIYEVEYREKRATFSPTEIAAAIFKKMMDTARSHGGMADSHDAVITIPLHFSEEQKIAIWEAANKAGFIVLRVISEPTAAVLAYDIGQTAKDTSKNVNTLVYRLGGCSLDITIVTVRNGMYKILASTHKKDVGGHKIEDILIDYFAAEFKRQWKYDCRENKRSVMKLRNASENCKHVLSNMQTTQCSVDSLFEGIDFQSTLSRSRLEGLCGSYLQQCVKEIETTLYEANMTKEDIHKVILCGGTTKMPSIQQQLQDWFPSAELLCSVPPDEVIALGAAKQASILSNLEESDLQTNEKLTGLACLPVNLLIQVNPEDPKYVTVLHKHTPVPVKRQQEVQLAEDQTSFCLHLLSGDNEDNLQSLAKVSMSQLRSGSKVNIVFHVKGDCSVSVTCTEPISNTSKHITIESS